MNTIDKIKMVNRLTINSLKAEKILEAKTYLYEKDCFPKEAFVYMDDAEILLEYKRLKYLNSKQYIKDQEIQEINNMGRITFIQYIKLMLGIGFILFLFSKIG